MRLSILPLMVCGVTALSAPAAAHPVHQAMDRYTECNQAASTALASEQLPIQWLASWAAFNCAAEEKVLADILGGDLKELRDLHIEMNIETIKRVRTPRLLAK